MNPKKTRIITLLLSGIILLLFGLNPILESILQGYIQTKLRLQQKSSPYSIVYEDLNLNIYSQELHLKGLRILPDASDTIQGDTIVQAGLRDLRVGSARIDGIELSNFLWNKSLKIHSIRMDSLQLTLVQRQESAPDNQGKTAGLVLDSLNLPGIHQIELGDFRLDHISSLLVSGKTGDTVSRFRSSDIRLSGMGLTESNSGNKHTFIPELDEMVFRLGHQQYSVGDGLYAVQYDSLLYKQKEELLRIDGFKLRPILSEDAFADRHSHSYERYSTEITEIRLFGASVSDLLSTGALKLRRIDVDQLSASIFRDKTKPVKAQQTTPLPSRGLEELNFPVSVDTLRFLESSFSYYERLPDTDKHVEVAFEALEGEFRNIRSAHWASESKESLEVHLNTNLLGALEITLNLEMPYGKDAIYMEGHTNGSSQLASLNPTVYPAMNMRFGDGQFDGMVFKASGNSRRMTGELTMLYSDLEVEMFKDDHSEARTLSWIANALVKHSNPNKRGKTLTAEINVQRDPAKGVMNYVWKGIKSGVVNTFNPLGKRHRE